MARLCRRLCGKVQATDLEDFTSVAVPEPLKKEIDAPRELCPACGTARGPRECGCGCEIQSRTGTQLNSH